MPPITQRPSREALAALFTQHGSQQKVADALGVSATSVRRWQRHYAYAPSGDCPSQPDNSSDDLPPGEEIAEDLSDDGGTVRAFSPRIRTLADLIREAKIDLSRWRIERHVINKWEMGAKLPDGRLAVEPLWQVKAWLRPLLGPSLDEFKDELTIAFKAIAPQYPPRPFPQKSRKHAHLLEVSPFDLHFGKYAWAQETGENYDSREAEKRLYEAVETLLDRSAGFAVERILLPLGNDLFHTDTPENTTARGTRQDVDTRWAKSFVLAVSACVRVIDRLLGVAPVEVVIVPGNHDMTRAFYLGHSLAQRYHATPHVRIDNAPTLRKYVHYGRTLLGFTHGVEEKPNDLPLIMAQEQPQAWAETEHREIHTGHFHKRKETRYVAGDTFTGVVVRILPSLSGTDAWHYRMGYVRHQRACEAYLWSKDDGYAGHLSSNVYDLRGGQES